MRLIETTWPEAGSPVLCVPIGSCEQHGPHLPLGTDAIVAERLAAALAGHRPRLIVAPTIGVSASGEHAGFPGTLSIGTDVMAAVVVELVRSADWARGVVLVNGHGGNRDAIDRAVATLGTEDRRVLAWWPHQPGGDAHAGHTETSLLLFLQPELVRLEMAAAGATAPIAELAPRLRAEGVKAVSHNGVLGDPSGADHRQGEAIFGRLLDTLVSAYDTWTAAAP